MAADGSAKSKSDSGWNDPPLFDYDSRQSHFQNSKRTSLTKRVPFPASSSNSQKLKNEETTPGSTPPKCSLASLPPLVCANIAASSVDVKCVDSSEPSSSSISECHFNDINDNFVVSLDILNGLDQKAAADVKRRLQMLENMWNEGKFNNDIKTKILKLSEALKNKDVQKSHDLQRSLMVDYPSLCSTWMPGVRRLIIIQQSPEEQSLLENN